MFNRENKIVNLFKYSETSNFGVQNNNNNKKTKPKQFSVRL